MRILLIILFAVFVFVLFFLPVEFDDIWWYLATGTWMVEHPQVPSFSVILFSFRNTDFFLSKDIKEGQYLDDYSLKTFFMRGRIVNKSRASPIVFLLPVLGALWFNIHVGALIYGIPLIGIFWLDALLNFV